MIESYNKTKDEAKRSYQERLVQLKSTMKEKQTEIDRKDRECFDRCQRLEEEIRGLNSTIRSFIETLGDEDNSAKVLCETKILGKERLSLRDEAIKIKREAETLQNDFHEQNVQEIMTLKNSLKKEYKKIDGVVFRKLLSEKITELSQEILKVQSGQAYSIEKASLKQKLREKKECIKFLKQQLASNIIQRRYQQIKKENGEMSGMEKQKYRRMANVLTDIKEGYDKEMQRLADECKTIEKEMKDLESEKEALKKEVLDGLSDELINYNSELFARPAYTTQSPMRVLDRSDLKTWWERTGVLNEERERVANHPHSRAPYRLSDIKDVQNKDILHVWLAILRLANSLKDSKFKSSESPSSSNQSANEFSFAQIEQEVRVLNAALTVLRNREITVRDLGETASVETYEAKIKECNSRVCENSIAGRLTFGECKDLVPILTEEKTEIVKLLGLQDQQIDSDGLQRIIESQLTVLKELEEAKTKLSEAEQKMQREQIDPLVIKQREKAEEKSRLALVNPKTYFKQKIAEQIAGAPISGARISGITPPTQSQTPLLDGLLGILDACDYCCPGALFDEKIQQIRRFTRTNLRPTIPRQTIPR